MPKIHPLERSDTVGRVLDTTDVDMLIAAPLGQQLRQPDAQSAVIGLDELLNAVQEGMAGPDPARRPEQNGAAPRVRVQRDDSLHALEQLLQDVSHSMSGWDGDGIFSGEPMRRTGDPVAPPHRRGVRADNWGGDRPAVFGGTKPARSDEPSGDGDGGGGPSAPEPLMSEAMKGQILRLRQALETVQKKLARSRDGAKALQVKYDAKAGELDALQEDKARAASHRTAERSSCAAACAAMPCRAMPCYAMRRFATTRRAARPSASGSSASRRSRREHSIA